MRIVIDMQGAQNGSRFRGIGRYTTAFAKHLIREAKNHEVILALNGSFTETIEPIQSEFLSLLPPNRILVWEPLCPANFLEIGNKGRRLTSEALREAFLASLKPDVVIISSMFEGAGDDVVSSIGSFLDNIPTAVILYDFIPLIYSNEYLADTNVKAWYTNKLSHMKKADLLLSISESSRLEGLEYLNCTEDSIVNISTAIESDFANSIGTPLTQVLKKFNLTRPYLMYSGASDPRKNLPRLVEAFSILPPAIRRKHQLLLAGGMPQNHIEALKLQISSLKLSDDEVRFTGHISDDEMIGLYRGALGFVFASYHEGFGLPILEAMAFDIPVIGSNISSIPEVIGNEKSLFDPFSVSSISASMHKLLTDAKFRENLSRHSKEQRKVFSWSLTAKKALSALVEKFENQIVTAHPFTLVDATTQQHLLTKHVATILDKQNTGPEELFRVAALIDYTLPRNNKLHYLFIDVSELQRANHKTGIQRVVSNIFSSLLKLVPNNYQIVPVYATRSEDYKVANNFLCQFLGFDPSPEIDHVLDMRNGDIFLGLDYQDQIIYDRRNYYENLRNRGIAVYFVVYDLLPQLLADTFAFEVTQNHSAWLKTVAKADGLICISRSVADELHTWLAKYGPARKSPLQIGYFHLGADFAPMSFDKKSDLDSQTVLAKIASQQSFLVVSTIEPRKRQSQVLEGFELLWSKGENVCLVLVGKSGWMVDDLIQRLKRHPEKNKRLFWLEGIDDQYLKGVYAASSCLIAASTGEGFGLSLVEAAQHKIHILARDIPVFKEVAGEHATYFTGEEGGDIATAVQNWCKLKLTNKAPTSTGMPILNWQQSTMQILDVLFRQKWYKQWCHDGVLRYSGSDNELGTEVGKRTRFETQSTGRQGYLLFGPYVDLKSGEYRIRLFGRANSLDLHGAYVDVASNSGQIVHGSTLLSKSDQEGQLAAINLKIHENASKVEVRVWVSKGSIVTVNSIQIAPIERQKEQYEHRKN
jgi:glycosyltransferase involved in cell wall biosynthesis